MKVKLDQFLRFTSARSKFPLFDGIHGDLNEPRAATYRFDGSYRTVRCHYRDHLDGASEVHPFRHGWIGRVHFTDDLAATFIGGLLSLIRHRKSQAAGDEKKQNKKGAHPHDSRSLRKRIAVLTSVNRSYEIVRLTCSNQSHRRDGKF